MTEICITAEKSRLRLLGEADLTMRYLGWLNDAEINRYSRRAGRKFIRPDMVEYLREAKANPNKLLFGVFLREDMYHVGNVLFEWVRIYSPVVELSNLFGEREECKRRKLGSVAVDANKHLIHYGFQKLGVRKFVMGNLAPNRAATLKSKCLGAEIEGRLRNHVPFEGGYADVLRFGLFADEFYAKFPELGR